MSTPDYELRERIDRVEDVESGDADLLTLAVPPDRSLGAVREEIEEALEFGAVERLLLADSLPVEEVTELEEEAAEAGGETVVVSTDFEGGQRFDQAFGGDGAILRFPIE